MWIGYSRILVLAGLFAASAAADPIQMTFTGVNGAADFGYYVGPYYGQMESQSVSLYCDDFANEVNFGQTWMANLSKITAGSDLSQTRYGGVTNALQDYQQIAWLDTQFAVQPTSDYGDIHATIWDIFDPAGAPAPSSDYWLKQAQQNYQTISYDNFRVITNVGPVTPTGQVQEFITMMPATNNAAVVATPEPQPIFLIGASLLMGGFAWSRIRTKRRVER